MAKSEQERRIIHRPLGTKELQVVTMQQTAIVCLISGNLAPFGEMIFQNPDDFQALLDVADSIPHPKTLEKVLMEPNADEMTKAQEYFPAILKFFEDDCCQKDLERLIEYHPEFVTFVVQINRDLGEQASQFSRTHIAMAALLRVDKKPLLYSEETQSAFSFLTLLWNYLDGRAELPLDQAGLKREVLHKPKAKQFQPKKEEEANLKQLSLDLLYRVKILDAFDQLHKERVPGHEGSFRQKDFTLRLSQVDLLVIGALALRRYQASPFLNPTEAAHCQERARYYDSGAAEALESLRKNFPEHWGLINDRYGMTTKERPPYLTPDEAIGVDLMDMSEMIGLGKNDE